MKRIDRETVNRILDAADIVEVVSDFVTLKRRGANYMGLCPFHAERTPSFSVSKAKGICKCFSCGKGGSPVGFLMELEQMSYNEALRWLARKYNITIEEREETEEERQASSEREALFAVNAFAQKHFENNLYETEAGRDIGLAYFKERGLNEATMRRFGLGYALERSDAFLKDALKNGFSEENLIKTGLCAQSERGVYDRFRGRVIYPVRSMSGKIVAFGGRTLRSDKNIAKYVNSPESSIYSKSRELYGLYEGRRAIVKEDKCILVEGYMDVLSMSQSGIENVVASSGTSLTAQQVNLIHRFTGNVTVIYDADAAGIKASLRGIDMLLAEGMNVKVVLFPEGEDPDSYARTHTHEQLAGYLNENETDFIKFKTQVLLNDTADDPSRRSAAISSILQSIAVIPDAITRQLYIEESAKNLGMDAKLLSLQVSRLMAGTESPRQVEPSEENTDTGNESSEAVNKPPVSTSPNERLRIFEHAIMRYLLRYGMLIIGDAADAEGNVKPFTVIEYVNYELNEDGLCFSDPTCSRLYERLLLMSEEFAVTDVEEQRKQLRDAGLNRIRNEATSVSQIMQAEKDLESRIETELAENERNLRREFFGRRLISDADDEVRRLVTELISEKHQLSKVHSKYGHVATEEERLPELVPRAVFELKDAILHGQIAELNEQIKKAHSDPEKVKELFTELIEKTKIRVEFAQYLGERIITPIIRL